MYLFLHVLDQYLRPPDMITHDAGTQFTPLEFKKSAKVISIDVKETPIKVQNSTGKVEKCHGPLRRCFEILKDEINAPDHVILQIAIKAINDTAGPNELVPTLLIFGAYLRITNDSPPSPSLTERARAMQKAMYEVRQLHDKRKVSDALRMGNGPNIIYATQLPLQSEVRVYRENGKWTGPFRLIATDRESCIVDIKVKPVKFR